MLARLWRNLAGFERRELYSTRAVYSFPIIANRTAYFAAGPGRLFAFNIESGELRWKLNTPNESELFSDPTTDGRRIFVTTRKNNARGGEDAILAIGLEP